MPITANITNEQITASVGETQIDVTVSGGIGPSGPVGGGYVLPIATSGSLGGVRIGSGISIDGDGIISASAGYTLPTATNSVLGGVKIGSGVTITDGVISVSTNYAAASHTHDFTQVTDDNTYTNFLPEGGSLATALSGIDSAISGKAASTDLVYVRGSGSNSVKPPFSGATSAGIGAVVLSGDPASADGDYAFVGGGSSNSAAGDYAVVAGGFGNAARTDYSSIAGGRFNDTDTFTNAHIVGAYITALANDYTYVNNLHIVGAWNGSALTGGALKFADGTTMSTAGAALSHAHGAITSDGKVGTTAGLVLKTGTAGAVEALAQGTAGQVLKVNSGATGVEWGAAAADVSIDTTAADILSASSGSITADDAGADKIVFWDDSAGKLTYLSAGTNITITDTTISAAGSTSASDLTSGTLGFQRLPARVRSATSLYLWSAFR